MQIYIILKNYHKDQQKFDRDYYIQLVIKCESLGIDMTWSRHHLKTGRERFAIINIPDVEGGRTPLHKINMFTSDMLMTGYRFVSHHPTKRHLTLKTIIEHFDALVIQQNKALLNELYSMEYELYQRVLH